MMLLTCVVVEKVKSGEDAVKKLVEAATFNQKLEQHNCTLIYVSSICRFSIAGARMPRQIKQTDLLTSRVSNNAVQND